MSTRTTFSIYTEMVFAAWWFVMNDDGFVAAGDTVRIRIEGDLLFIRNSQMMTIRDLHGILAAYSRIHQAHHMLFVMYDCTHARGMDRDARKALTGPNKVSALANATAIFGASFAIRTLGNMVERAVVGLGRPSTGIRFFPTEAEARAYLMGERARALAARQSSQ